MQLYFCRLLKAGERTNSPLVKITTLANIDRFYSLTLLYFGQINDDEIQINTVTE